MPKRDIRKKIEDLGEHVNNVLKQYDDGIELLNEIMATLTLDRNQPNIPANLKPIIETWKTKWDTFSEDLSKMLHEFTEMR
jgi:hypothetical protein